MRSQSSWNLSQVAPDARTAARVAARNAGVPLGEWLTRQILDELHAEETTNDFKQTFEQLDAQAPDLTDRLIDIEEQIRTNPLRNAVKKLHDGLTKLNTELVQVTGHTAIQSSALAAKIAGFASQLAQIRLEAAQSNESLESNFDKIEGRLQTRDIAFEDGVMRANADISAMHTHFSEKSRESDQAITQLETWVSEAAKNLEGLRSTIETTREEAAGSVRSLQQWLDAAFESSSSKTASELVALDANLKSMQADVTGRSRDIERHLGDLSEQLRGRISQLATGLDNLASDAKASDSRIADDFRSAQDMHRALADRVTLQETHLVNELSNRDADQAGVRSETLQRMEELKKSVDATTTATAQNSAVTSELSDRTGILERIQNGAAEKADTLECGLGELRAKFDTVCADAVKTSSAWSDMRGELEQVLTRRAADFARIDSVLRALKEELSSLGSDSAGKIAVVENCLADLWEQSSQRISALKAELDRANARVDASYSKSLEISGALEQRFASWTEQSRSDVRSLSERIETVDSKVAQAVANVADIGRKTEPRLTALEQSLTDLGTKFCAADKVTSGSYGALRQLLTQLGNQSTGELQSLKARVELIGGTLESYQGEAAQNGSAMSDRVDFMCQALESAETRQKELLNLLAASQEREAVATNAICVIEEKLKVLESRMQGPPEVHAGEFVGSSEKSEPIAQANVKKCENNEPADLAENNARAEAREIDEPANSADKSTDAHVSDFDEWDCYDEEPQVVVPPVGPVANVASKNMEGHFASSQQEEQAKPLGAPAQIEYEDGSARDTVTTSIELPPIVQSQFLQPDAVNGPNVIPTGITSELAFSATDSAQNDSSGPRSFISAARLAARNAAERAEADQDEAGAFRRYFKSSQGEASPAHGLRKPVVQVGAAAVLLAICFATTKYISGNQSIVPRAQAAIRDSGGSMRAPGAAAIQTAVRPIRALNIAGSASGASGDASGNRNDADNETGFERGRDKASEPINEEHKLDRITALALAGDARAQLMVGLLYLNAANGSEAVKWLGLAASQGNAVAQYRLGALYAAGREVPVDQAHAAQLYTAAANLGNRKAMYNLALAYAQGKGVSKKPAEAVRWFLKAANLGLVDAQFDLAVLYERGTGVPQSLLDAYRWYAIASKNGDKESQQRVQILATQMPVSDQAVAQKSADEFKAFTRIPEANSTPSML